MRKSKIRYGSQRTAIVRLRGELHNWREVHGNNSSYFAGVIHNDPLGIHRDGQPMATSPVIRRVDRGTYLMIRTIAGVVYKCPKDKEFKG